jgi:membrane protein DedA with SNARE-associated domain
MGKKKYFTYLLISCLIWAAICTYGGYFFGATLKNFVGNLKEYTLPIAFGVLAVGFIIWLLRDVVIRRSASDIKR